MNVSELGGHSLIHGSTGHAILVPTPMCLSTSEPLPSPRTHERRTYTFVDSQLCVVVETNAFDIYQFFSQSRTL
jgi:hypothetical protein